MTSVDTSEVIDNKKWSLRRVSGADSPQHEWALLPYSANDSRGTNDMLLMGKSAASSTYASMRRSSVDTVVSTTSCTDVADRFITVVASDAIMGDASIVSARCDAAHNTVVATSSDETRVLPNAFLFWDGHPTLSADGKLMVFASDRTSKTGETSLGGTDLWYSVRENQSWSIPKLLQGGVNTPCDELSPFYTKSDSTLLFASAGHSAVGGYDLFEADVYRSGTTLKVGAPRNLGKPVNSEFDELFPRVADKNTLYFSSDRPADGTTQRKDFDVFVFVHEKLKTPQKNTKTKPKSIVSGTVIDKQSNQPVSDVSVTARDVANNTVVGQTRTDTLGQYDIKVPVETQIEITAQAPDLFFDNVRVIVPMQNVNDTFRLQRPLALPEVFVLRVNFPTAIFDDPYEHTLDSNGTETTQTWGEELDLLARNVSVSGQRLKKLLLIGHTDDVDDDSSNMVLGRNRVNFVMDELVKRGVRRELLEGRSAGESLLPEKRRGESIDIWRKRSRRVELVKVLAK